MHHLKLISTFYSFDFIEDLRGEVGEAAMACHLSAIHACYAVVDMLTAAMMRSLAGKTVDEIGFSKQGTPHLHELETFGKHLFHALAVDNTAHIYERKLERGAETLRVFKEIKGLERLFR